MTVRRGTDGFGSLLDPGEKVAERFRVERFLTSGRLGEIYEATDDERRRPVALRILPADLLQDAQWHDLLQKEVGRATRIVHPHVCRTFGLFSHPTSEGIVVPVVVVDLLSGEFLDEALKRIGQLSLKEAGIRIRQIAEALEAAHRVGLIHRNLQPRNILLLPDRVVVADFGLTAGAGAPLSMTPGFAKPGTSSKSASSIGRSGSRSATSPGSSSGTGSGILGGVAAYMAPEQLEGGKITPATDVYALGVLFYEMVTGDRPFAGETPLAAAYRRLHELPPAPRSLVPELDPVWENVIFRSMEPESKNRIRRVEDFLRAMDGEAPRRNFLAYLPAGSLLKNRGLSSAYAVASATAAILVTILVGVLVVRTWPGATDIPARESVSERRSIDALPVREDARRFYFRGLQAHGEHRWSDARDLLEQAARLEPESPLVHLAAAEIYDALGEVEKARKAADQALQRLRESARTDPILEARAHAAARRRKEAADRFEALERNASTRDLRLRRLRNLLAAGQAEEALQALGEMRSQRAEDPQLDLEEARIFAHLGQTRRSRDVAQRVAQRAAEATGDPHLRAQARLAEAWAQYDLDRKERALAAAGEARALFETTRDRAGSVRALVIPARIRAERGKYEEADTLLGEALTEVRLLGHRAHEMEILGEFSRLRMTQGLFEEAVTFEESALAIAREVGDLRGVTIHLARLAAVWNAAGNIEQAQVLLRESSTVARILGDQTLIDARGTDLRRLRR